MPERIGWEKKLANHQDPKDYYTHSKETEERLKKPSMGMLFIHGNSTDKETPNKDSFITFMDFTEFSESE